MPKIREVRSYGYYKMGKGVRRKAKYTYTRRAFFFPVAFERELANFLGLELTPRIEDNRIVLEPQKKTAEIPRPNYSIRSRKIRPFSRKLKILHAIQQV